jgi:hypothetical protein
MEIKSIQQSGYTLRILTDDNPDSPADWDNLGQIAYSSSRYTLGTEAVSKDRLDEIAAGIEDGSLIGLPVYAYVHSGATISTSPFGCRWDSGQSGFVYCSASDAEDEWAGDPHFRANALRVLQGEVETFDQYLRGDVYGYTITDKDGDEVDSCWGYYGIEYAEEEARSALNYWATQQGELFAA